MTRATLDYLLRLAIADRDQHARRMIEAGEECPDGAYGEASAAVRELLELSTSQSPAATLGRKGGKARVSKGPNANKTPGERAEWAAKMVASRATRKSASQPPRSKPSKPR